MRHFIFFIFLLSIYSNTYSQFDEFKTFPNGLIYSNTTMNQLAVIVDSLNLKFKKCELSKDFFSQKQAKANYFSLKKGNILEAKADLENNISFELFIKKYPHTVIDSTLLVTKHQYTNYNDESVIVFNSILSEHDVRFINQNEMNDNDLENSWAFKYQSKGEYHDEKLSGFYFITDFNDIQLPDTYARLVQYSNCMIDTTTGIYFENAERTGVRIQTEQTSKMLDFIKMVYTQTNKPTYDQNKYTEDNYDEYYNDLMIWDSLRIEKIDTEISKQAKFKTLLEEAVAEAKTFGGSSEEFEYYVGRYYGKSTALELKRSRIVVGGCSMDDSPRVHAMQIAILSAETVKWDIFLRAHLDIMNDRFERASDGSYAWERRQTYIQELEELEINVTDLLLGISLRIDSPAEFHYYGSINRIGRALSETKNSLEIEEQLLKMIADEELDDYNRILMYYLFINYNYHIKDQKRHEINKNRLKTIINKLPMYLQKNIALED